MKFIFEDSSKAPISKLIESLYSGTNIDVVFAKGNKNLKKLLSDNCLIYVDVVPDNLKTVKAYNAIADIMIKKRFKRCFLIPIPCIEYICIDAFNLDRSENAVQSVLRHNDYRIVDKYRGRGLSLSSFEKYCKSVLYNYMACTNASEIFWKEDCLCHSYKDDILCSQLNLDDKASKIVLHLPLSCAIEKHRQYKERKSIEGIQAIYLKCIKLISEMTENFMMNGYITTKINLRVLDYIELNR